MRQRSEQNGLQGFEGAKSAGFPHAGQATDRPSGLLPVMPQRLQNESSNGTSCS